MHLNSLPYNKTLFNKSLDLGYELPDKWNDTLEFVLILVITIFSIPANFYLIAFYVRKVREYKQRRAHNPNEARLTNSFYTYIIEISSFDTTLVVYLILDASFKLLSNMGKSQYESVYDISNFTCKFFIYVVRISSAMSNYLVCLLSFNRCMLLTGYQKDKDGIQGYRVCFNTKYLTLFVFCICTIANVFRLESLRLNNRMNKETTSPAVTMLAQYLASVEKSKMCGPNIRLAITKSSDSIDSLFWILFLYNLIFTIVPIVLNACLAIYMTKKQSEMKRNLDTLTKIFKKIEKKSKTLKKRSNSLVRLMNIVPNQAILVQVVKPRQIDLNGTQNYKWLIDFFNCSEYVSTMDQPEKLDLNVFHVEFIKTCAPCIVLAVAQVILLLPYAIVEVTNQFWPNVNLVNSLQYITYIRYLFYGLKFYLMCLTSRMFRKELRLFFTKSKKSKNFSNAT